MESLSIDLLSEYCVKNKKSLTPTRLLIIKTLFNHTKPQSAYELQNQINNNKVNINISTIYRVLEFWIKIVQIITFSPLGKISFVIRFIASINLVGILFLEYCSIC